jgi:hypothetical protein
MLEKDIRWKWEQRCFNADEWNKRHHVGTRVRYFPVINDSRNCPFYEGVTTGPAYIDRGLSVVPVQGALFNEDLTVYHVQPIEVFRARSED